ncbi:TadE/TadG family type IV pilus assembly protein [Sphingobium sp. AN558]|uniref:Tad domain-containing protein n=1 Tax=Sphingobium sp. AN558 TaxID=3133442 RepID=UPI0030BCCA58
MGFLGRLQSNQAGNVLVLVAAGFLPLLGFIGGGVDMARIYLVKTRLQHACDAGALAGRKQMGGGAWSATNYKARTTAEGIFNINYVSGSYGSSGLTKSFVESQGKVSGTASVVLPMTIMVIFGQSSKTISVVCDAEMRIPNTDVMFVLDTTGSMASTNPGDSDTKINGLKTAVKCFYEALAKIDTSANCGTDPVASRNNSVQLRFGFVPYSSNVNVGRLLLNEWMVDAADYQSRQAKTTGGGNADGYKEGKEQVVSTQQVPYSMTYSAWENFGSPGGSSCTGKIPADNIEMTGTEGAPYDQTTTASGADRVVGWSTNQDGRAYNYQGVMVSGKCQIQRRYISGYLKRLYQRTDSSTFKEWEYDQHSFDVSGLKAGGGNWNAGIMADVGPYGKNATIAWDGCIEERQTFQNMDDNPVGEFSPVPASAYDMNIDMLPTSADATRWRPLLPDLVWGRYDKNGNWTTAKVKTTSDLSRNYTYACPAPASKLQTYSGASAFETYVNSLYPNGNTYHDIGLLWGARLLSPTGLFASENAFTPAGGEIERHIVFMTDGDTVTNAQGYTAHGVAWWDRRQTRSNAAPSDTLLTAVVNERTKALCSAIKAKNITLWVVSFGTGVSSGAQALLQSCASPNRFYTAANSATLTSNFQQIADEISQLRLTK